MASNQTVKGITIEIGGDTTKFGNAISEIKKSTSGLSKELKGVNKLLEMDPGNIDLISQKESILAETVEKTKERLEAAQKAMEQVSSGKITLPEDEFRNLQREVIASEQAFEKAKTALQDFQKSGDSQMPDLNKKISDCTTTTKTLKDELSQINSSLKLDPGNVDLLKQKQDNLTQSVENTEEKLKACKEEMALINSGQVDVTDEEFKNLKTTIAETEAELKNGKTELENFGSVGAQQAALVGDAMQGVGDKITTVGTKLTTVVTGSIAALGTGATKTAADFETAMSNVQATLGATSDSESELNGQTVNTMEALSNLAKDMGEKTAFSASESADAINTLAQSGLDVQQIYDVLPSVMNLAAAGNLSIADSATYVTSAIKGFGDSMDNASIYADMIAKGANLANTDVSELGTAFSQVSATANTYGQSQEGITESLLRLAEANVTGSEAATGLSSAMTKVYAPTDEAQKALDALGVSAYDSNGKARDFNDVVDDLSSAMDGMSEAEANAATKAIFGSSRLEIFNDIAGTSKDKVDLLKDGLDNAAGSAQNMSDIKLDNLNGQLTLLKDSIEGAAIDIGESLIPYIKDLVKHVQDAANWFNDLSDSEKDMVIKAALIVAALGPVLTIVGKLTSGVGTLLKIAPKISGLVTALKGATSIGDIGAALGLTGLGEAAAVLAPIAGIIAGITAAIIILSQNEVFVDSLKDAFAEMKNAVGQLGDALKPLAELILPALKTAFEIAWGQLINVVNAAAPVIIFAVKTITNIIQTISTVIQGVVDIVSGIMSGDWSQVWQGAQAIIQAPIEFIIGQIQNVISTIKDFSGMGVSAPDLSGVVSVFSSMVETVIGFVSGLPGRIWGYISGIPGRFLTAFNGAKTNAITAVSGLSRDVLKYVTALPGKFITAGKNTIKGFIEGFTGDVADAVDSAKDFASDIISGVRNILGIHSPSKVFNNIGQMITAGLAGGISETAKTAVTAASSMIDGVTGAVNTGIDGISMDGASIERNISLANTSDFSGILSKIDGVTSVLNALLSKDSNLYIDRDTLIGSTAEGYDREFDVRALLAERGV